MHHNLLTGRYIDDQFPCVPLKYITLIYCDVVEHSVYSNLILKCEVWLYLYLIWKVLQYPPWRRTSRTPEYKITLYNLNHKGLEFYISNLLCTITRWCWQFSVEKALSTVLEITRPKPDKPLFTYLVFVIFWTSTSS